MACSYRADPDVPGAQRGHASPVAGRTSTGCGLVVAACSRRRIEELSDEFTVVARDAPGTGHSSAGWGGSLPPEVADRRLTQPMRVVGVPPCSCRCTAWCQCANTPAVRRRRHSGPGAAAEHLNAAIFGSRLVVLRNAGHLCNFETAGQCNQ